MGMSTLMIKKQKSYNKVKHEVRFFIGHVKCIDLFFSSKHDIYEEKFYYQNSDLKILKTLPADNSLF